MVTDVHPDLSLGHYFQALTGRRAYLQRVDASEPATYPDTWTMVRLPQHADDAGDVSSRHIEDLISLTHRAAHYSEGTFDFSLDGIPHRFDETALKTLGEVASYESDNQLEIFFRLFGRASLALDIFAVLEDTRIDSRVREAYMGLAGALDGVQRAELRDRLDSVTGPRNQMMEALIRLSLGATQIEVAEIMEPAAKRVMSLVAAMREPGVNVHDTAVATMLAYDAIDRLPSMAPASSERVRIPVNDCGAADPADDRYGGVGSQVTLEGDEVLDVDVKPVRYRDSLGARVWSYDQPHRLRDAIYRIVASSSGEEAHHAPHHEYGPEAAKEALQKAKSKDRQPLPHEHIHVPPVDPAVRDTLGPLTRESRRQFLYPEWDDVARAYLPNMCRVVEYAPVTARWRQRSDRSELDGAMVRRTKDLIAGITPERTRSTAGHEDGDEIDIDAAIEARIDRDAGLEPDPRVYQRQEPVERDIAFGILIDLSASTSDKVMTEDDVRTATSSATDARGLKVSPRILDVQLDSAELLLRASQGMGDSSLVMGYSGTGADDVRIVVVKECRENVDANVLRRLRQLKPIHMTRTGAAVRHAAMRLSREPQTSKHLIILTDGRPFDVDYGQKYGDDNALLYASADTRRALEEATAMGVNPVIVAIDKYGDDYLRDICGELEYHVVSRAADLPDVLGSVYRGLQYRRRGTIDSLDFYGSEEGRKALK